MIDAFDKINPDELNKIAGDVALKDLDEPHRKMLNFLMEKLDRTSFEDLLKSINETNNIDEARRLIEIPYGVQAGH